MNAAAHGFVRALRGAGLDVPVPSAVTYAEALAVIGADDPGGVYWAGRACLVRRVDDVVVYDAVFVSYWGDRIGGLRWRPPQEPREVVLDNDDDGIDHDGEDGESGDRDVETVRYSAAEVLGAKDFAEYSDDELDVAHEMMRHLARTGPDRRGRRRRPHRGARGRLDLRRTVAHARRAGGEPMRLIRTEVAPRPRRVVVLLDVSGSMEPYARALLRFVQATVAARPRVEAFALGTRLTRLTRELSTHDPDRALRVASQAVPDWSGGTRLGEGLRRFNDEWGCRGMARGAVVVVLSDGWDRGSPELMDAEMARLHRVAERVVWVNPLKASPGYQPLARGMAAALPHIDRFVEGHSLDALAILAETLAAESVAGAA